MNQTTTTPDPKDQADPKATDKPAAKKAPKIEADAIRAVMAVIDGDSRPLDNLLAVLGKDFKAKSGRKGDFFILDAAGQTGKSRVSQRDAVTNWKNKARRALLQAA